MKPTAQESRSPSFRRKASRTNYTPQHKPREPIKALLRRDRNAAIGPSQRSTAGDRKWRLARCPQCLPRRQSSRRYAASRD
jgi:hypothetical protein